MYIVILATFYIFILAFINKHFKAWDCQTKASKIIKALKRKGGRKFLIDPQMFLEYKAGFYELQSLDVIELEFRDIDNVANIILTLKGE